MRENMLKIVYGNWLLFLETFVVSLPYLILICLLNFSLLVILHAFLTVL